MTLWLLGQHQPEMRVVGEGLVAWKERMPGLVYLDVALVPDSPISVALDRSINLPGPHFSNYKVSLRGAVRDENEMMTAKYF